MKYIPLHLTLSVLLLSACGSSDNPKKDDQLSKKINVNEAQGLWVSDGYSRLVEITENNIAYYQFSQSHCLQVDEDDAEELSSEVTINNKNNRFSTEPDMLTTYHPYFYDKVSERPAACINGVTENTDDPVINFQAFWDTFNEQYAFFELHNVNWQDVYNQYLLKTEQIRDTGEGELTDIMREILPLLNDGHVSIEYSEDEDNIESEGLGLVEQRLRNEFLQEYSSEELEESYSNDPEGANSLEEYIEEMASDYLTSKIFENIEITDNYLSSPLKQTAGGNIRWGTIEEGNIGYLAVFSMIEFLDDDEEFDGSVEQIFLALETALDEVMVDLQNTNAIIIDVRLNSGGLDSAGFTIAGRFYDKSRAAFRKRAKKENGFSEWLTINVEPTVTNSYQKPIYLLTSDLTNSAAETFTLAMKELPYVTHIGEATNGYLSDALNFSLPNGWQVSLSNEIFESIDGNIYEDIGIPVDINALYLDKAAREQAKDAGIEAVLEHAL